MTDLSYVVEAFNPNSREWFEEISHDSVTMGIYWAERWSRDSGQPTRLRHGQAIVGEWKNGHRQRTKGQPVALEHSNLSRTRGRMKVHAAAKARKLERLAAERRNPKPAKKRKPAKDRKCRICRVKWAQGYSDGCCTGCFRKLGGTVPKVIDQERARVERKRQKMPAARTADALTPKPLTGNEKPAALSPCVARQFTTIYKPGEGFITAEVTWNGT